MKAIKSQIIILFLICITVPFSYAQDGQSKASNDGGVSFSLEHLWSTQIDPRWKAGEVIGDVEDGITVEFIEFSADGEELVTGNGQGEAFILNAADGSIKQSFTYITEEEVSRIDKERIASISGGYTKRLEVECGTFTPDGKFLIIGGNLNGLKVFNLPDGSLFKHIEVDDEVDGICISPDGRFLAYAARRSVKVISTENWKVIQDIVYGPDSELSVVNSIHYDANGNFMIVGGNAGNVIMVRTKDWKTVGDGLIPDASNVKSVRISPDERLIAAGNGGGEINVWRTWDMSLVFQFSCMIYMEAVAWSPDGRYLMAGGRDDGEGRLMVFRSSDWQMVGNPQVLADGASLEYIDVHGDLLAICGEDGHVRLFRVNPK